MKYKTGRRNIINKLLVIFILTGLISFVYEYFKQLLFPNISLWESRAISITLISFLNTIFFYYYFLCKRYQNKLRKNIDYQYELKQMNNSLEDIIKQRTQTIEQYNNELINAKEKAQESTKLKNFFLQNISHEIRTPLNAILGFSQLIKQSQIKKENYIQYASIIYEQGLHLLNIIDTIIDKSKLDADQLSLRINEYKLLDLVRDIEFIYEKLQSKFKKYNIELKINFDDSKDIKIFTDKYKLKQIFTYLIDNALKFTQTGTIEVGCKGATMENTSFYVSDTGIGIDEEKINSIFNSFEQADKGPLSREHGGIGLGLSNVKGLVELLNGTISVFSKKGHGSIFTFTFPRILYPSY